MSECDRILEATDAHAHFVQLFDGDHRALTRNVGKYLAEGLSLGGGIVVVSTTNQRAPFLAELERRGWQPDRLAEDGRLDCLDAVDTLARFMVNGYPDAGRFDVVVGDVVRAAIARAGDCGLRAYGDMVGVLWGERQYPAAIRLEQLWNKLRENLPFSLFCAYPVDVFGRQFDVGILDAMLCAHTHLLPAYADGHFERAVDRAMAEVLGPDETAISKRTAGLRSVWAAIPKSEAIVLWLRKNAPDKADQILDLARDYCQMPA